MSRGTPRLCSQNTSNGNTMPSDLPPSYVEAAHGMPGPSTPAPQDVQYTESAVPFVATELPMQPHYDDYTAQPLLTPQRAHWAYNSTIHANGGCDSSDYQGSRDGFSGMYAYGSYEPQQCKHIRYHNRPVRDQRSFGPKDFDKTLPYPAKPSASPYSTPPPFFQTIPEDYVPFERHAPPPELAAAAAYRDQVLSTLSPSYLTTDYTSPETAADYLETSSSAQPTYAQQLEMRSENSAEGQSAGSELTRIKVSNQVFREQEARNAKSLRRMAMKHMKRENDENERWATRWGRAFERGGDNDCKVRRCGCCD